MTEFACMIRENGAFMLQTSNHVMTWSCYSMCQPLLVDKGVVAFIPSIQLPKTCWTLTMIKPWSTFASPTKKHLPCELNSDFKTKQQAVLANTDNDNMQLKLFIRHFVMEFVRLLPKGPTKTWWQHCGQTHQLNQKHFWCIHWCCNFEPQEEIMKMKRHLVSIIIHKCHNFIDIGTPHNWTHPTWWQPNDFN